ncbi:2-C-methyl-D-erythritol 4-phosphate cytidylyltransferase, partial [human gut metagenome]
IVLGGRERQDSVAYGLKAVSEDSNIVLVHDGARPLASTKLFDSVVRAAIEYPPKGINILFSLYPIRRPAPAARTIQLIALPILSSIYT